jgi:antitoxin (DNA-binding transcriptional repressor) of toxin-antitoxin stability system
MGTHSVAEAKNKLAELIDRALRGEDVVITRHGRPVVELKAVPAPPQQITREAIEWVATRRIKVRGDKTNAAELVRNMRDEEWR